jgi:Heavy metal binding domain
VFSLILLSALLGSAQDEVETRPLDYVCPMDPDVRATAPGSCSRCGMKLVAGAIDSIEYGVDLKLQPSAPSADRPIELIFTVSEASTGKPPEPSCLRVKRCYDFESDKLVVSITPHMHYRGKDARYELVRPDGRRETLLFVSPYDFNWQSVMPLPRARLCGERQPDDRDILLRQQPKLPGQSRSEGGCPLGRPE